MGASASTPTLTFSSASPEKVEAGPDYSLMRLCDKDVKKFEYMLFIAAESSRLVYSDVGIIHQSLKAYGLSPDILNQVITHYDWKFLSKRRNIASRVSGDFKAPESYELSPCADGFDHGGKQPLIQYISSPTDTTCMVVSPSALKPNPNSILQPTDCMVVFKGSSSIRNWEKNFRSVAPGNFAQAINPVVQGAPADISVATAFVVPIVEIFDNILQAIDKVSPGNTRIFVFGHSKGGAEAELFGAMVALKFPDREVHIISLGAPKVIFGSSKDSFDKFFFVGKQGRFTLTRVESVGQLKGDSVTDVAPPMVHPGWGTKTDTLDSLRASYGIKPDGNNKRNAATWPFAESMDLMNITSKLKLRAEVQKIIGEAPKEPPEKGGANYLRVKGNLLVPDSHMEYFGMFFLGSQRLAGMGNPAKTSNTGTRESNEGSNENKIFVANIFDDCTKYQYVPWVSRGSVLDFATKDVAQVVAPGLGSIMKKLGRGRKTRRKKPSRRTTRK